MEAIQSLIRECSGSQVYPVPSTDIDDKFFLDGYAGGTPIYCPVCGEVRSVTVAGDNLRETIVCSGCGSTNRQRQVAVMICSLYGVPSLQRFIELQLGIAIYNTESTRCLHDVLKELPGYVCSELWPDGIAHGDVRHEDIQALTLPDESFDLVISTDLLEHVPHPYMAHQEIQRVLKPGGEHVFTVPFHQNQFREEVRAVQSLDGTVTHLREPFYHGDPVTKAGSFVYRVFALDMLCKLSDLKLQPRMFRLHMPELGILGENAIVFLARRPYVHTDT